MRYLSYGQYESIKNEVALKSIQEIENVEKYSFDSGIEEYNDFLKVAKKYWELNISKTFLLIHKRTNELIAYMTLSADSIKLKRLKSWLSILMVMTVRKLHLYT